tara:strand:+ start:6740 stop:7603 length:864 start_codon:yes stop_codon:yes gene_type:complete
MMPNSSVVIIGLPGSGKTTYLAALWHSVTSQELETKLKFGKLTLGNQNHLNTIASRWREARVQDRTAITGDKIVSMNLATENGHCVDITFPDLPGELYQDILSNRDCRSDLIDHFHSSGVLLFIHADTIEHPRWVFDDNQLGLQCGLKEETETPVEWQPNLAPTQVKVVDLLQVLSSPPLNVGVRKLAIMLSAWDKVEDEQLPPAEYVRQKMPLLDQYLKHGTDCWNCRIFGLSAQGGDYDPADDTDTGSTEAEKLRELDAPTSRIKLNGPESETHDLTIPLAWIIE